MTETAWLLELSEVSGGRARRRYWAGSYWALFAQHAVPLLPARDAEQTRAWLISAGVTLAAAAVSHEHAWVPSSTASRLILRWLMSRLRSRKCRLSRLHGCQKTQGTGNQRGPGRRFAPARAAIRRAGRRAPRTRSRSKSGSWPQHLLHDARYRAGLEERLHGGKVAPAVECMLWHYAYGKPKETVQLQNPDGSSVVIREVLGASGVAPWPSRPGATSASARRWSRGTLTPDELREVLWRAFRLRLPDVRVCEHHTPWAAFCDAFFARAPVVVWKGLRGLAGKTFSLGLLTVAEGVFLGADVNLLGGSGQQSKLA